MKKLTSLIVAISILFQIWIPTQSNQLYANTKGPYQFQWIQDERLNDSLKIDKTKLEEGALFSWNVKGATGKYVLEYYIESEDPAVTTAEKVRFTFERIEERNDKANVYIEVFDASDNLIEKKYSIVNFDDLNAPERVVTTEKTLKLSVQKGLQYPGGRIGIGTKMEISYMWKLDDTVYFQTNFIKGGNITPFKLYHGTSGNPETIDVLTGLADYKISPVHLEKDKDNNIVDKKQLQMPGDDSPGSKPGIKVQFKRPYILSGNQFIPVQDNLNEFIATLDLGSVNPKEEARVVFDLAGSIKTESIIGKTIGYKADTNIYTMLIAKDDLGSNEIIKWDKLNPSMILTNVKLTLKRETQLETQSLGAFAPTTTKTGVDIGRYTYIQYTVKRSSIEDAYIEVQPYKGANIEFTYEVQRSSDRAKWDTLVEHKYISKGDNSDEKFAIPIPFSSNHEDEYYKVIVHYTQGSIESQVLHYQPKKDLTIPPPTPMIEGVNNIYVVPPMKLGDQPQAIGFDLTWKAPRNTTQSPVLQKLLQDGDIYYELYVSEEPNAPKEGKTLLKVFKVSLDGNEIVVEPYAGTAGESDTEKQKRYSSLVGTFTMEKVVLKQAEEKYWEQIAGININDENGEIRTSYPEKNEIVVDNQLKKEVPNIYYLTMKAVFDPHDTEAGKQIKMGISNESIPYSLSLSNLEEIIPVPTEMESKHLPDQSRPNTIIQGFSWRNVNISRYQAQMLEPLHLQLKNKDERTYEIYLYQNKNVKESDLLEVAKSEPTLITTDAAITLSSSQLQALRKGEAIRFDYTTAMTSGTNTIQIENLDSNQVYYITTRVRLDIQGQDARYSVFSKQHNFTTYSKPSEPQPGERVPPVPEELTIISQPNNTTAMIGWKAPNYKMQEDEILYYEVMRIESRALAKEEDSRLFSIESILQKDTKKEMKGWRTKEPYVHTYDISQSKWKESSPQIATNLLRLEDGGLNTNTLYYYYVRSVLEVEQERVYSSWVGIPVTTDPIQKPIQLTVENQKNYSHDPKKEMVVSFMAPIPQDGKIPEEYDFDIAIQGELDEDYRLNYTKNRITSKLDSKNIPTGYTHIVYQISGLTPAKRYDVKVRIVDKTKEAIDGNHPKSLYSERVTTRTQFDQDEQDKENKFKEYIKYYEDQAEKLRRNPYWTGDDGKDTLTIKYRSSYMNAEAKSKSTYPLVTKQGSSRMRYYIPADAINHMNLHQVTFEVQQGDVTYIVRPSTIIEEMEDIQALLQDIQEKRMRDYYILFEFEQISKQISVYGEQPLTPQISVQVRAVSLKDYDYIIEDDIMSALNTRIESEKVYVIEELEKALQKGKVSDEQLDRIVKQAIEYVQTKHRQDVTKIITNNTSKTRWIDQWNNSMLIMIASATNQLVQGYYLEKAWISLPTFNVNTGFGLEAQKEGVYIFTQRQISMPPIPGVSGGTTLIAQYQLTDFLGFNGQINPYSTVNKRGLLNSMARVLGASRGADYTQYLKQVGIQGITSRGMDTPITNQEGIYFLMQVYEKIGKKQVASVYVKNRNCVSNIRQFNSLYQPYVIVAVDSKILTPSGTIDPKGHMQVKDILQMLTNIMKQR